MFTGIIKLAQIDDYISPSQNCIQPKIIKPTKQQQKKATVSLNDCLACSGCITSAQSILIEQMSLKKFKELINPNQQQNSEVIIIISPQSLLSLSRYYKMNPKLLFQKISAFFKNNFKSIKQVHNLTSGIKICHDLIYEQYLQKSSKQQTVLCSECPGWICYAQKTLNLQITQLMSQVKSPQQILSRILKESHKSEQNGKALYPKVVSVMPCYDKKLQAIRFEIESSIKQLDLTLTTTQIVDLLKEFPQNQLQIHQRIQIQSDQCDIQQISIQNKNNQLLQTFEKQKNQQNQMQTVSFLKDQTSNGYIQNILSKLKVTNLQIKQIKNSDFVQYTALDLENKQIKMAKCYGFRNIQKIVQSIKKKKCIYSYIQIMACPGGCSSGGGQIRYPQIKQKQISEDFKKMAEPYVKHKTLEQIQQKKLQLQANKANKFKVSYKPIQKTLSQSVMNW